jgi:hypothetical protein
MGECLLDPTESNRARAVNRTDELTEMGRSCSSLVSPVISEGDGSEESANCVDRKLVLIPSAASIIARLSQ